jgi:hypothetical protein
VTAKKDTTEPKLVELKINDENWVKVMKYVADNKSLGLSKIVEQLERKYKVTSTIKKSIASAIK